MTDPDVTLKEFILHKLNDMEKMSAALARQMERRLDGMNEFREALKDQSDKMMPRDEFIITHQKVMDDIEFLRESRAMLEGKASQVAVNVSLFLALAGVLISVISLIIHLK